MVGGFVVVVGEGVVIWFHQVLTNRMMLYSTHVFFYRSRKMATVENPWGSVERTVPSGEFLGCLHCAAGQCEGSLGIFLGQTLGCKTLSTVSSPSTLSLGDSFSTLPL